MKIQIDGTNDKNKGAELMLYAILDEIKNKRGLDDKIIVNSYFFSVKKIKHDFKKLIQINKYRLKYIIGILRRLNIPFSRFTVHSTRNEVPDVIFDASGFLFSDKWSYPLIHFQNIYNYYKYYKNKGAKVILLPQAFGPFETVNGKKCIEIINDCVDFVYARDSVSYTYLKESGVDMNKVKISPDFTLKIKPKKNESFQKEYVTVIPNVRMIDKGLSNNNYLTLLETIVGKILDEGNDVILLNHEGNDDLAICKQIYSKFENQPNIQIMDGLNALEVKSVIGGGIATISSRFHGVASSLNQRVPCIATSWSHKYEQLFKDFGFSPNERIIDLSTTNYNLNIFLEKFLEKNNLINDRFLLEKSSSVIEKQIEDMWNEIWSFLKK